jgi:hypothetical protein
VGNFAGPFTHDCFINAVQNCILLRFTFTYQSSTVMPLRAQLFIGLASVYVNTHQSPIRIKALGRRPLRGCLPAPGSIEPQKILGSRPCPIVTRPPLGKSLRTNLWLCRTKRHARPCVARGQGVLSNIVSDLKHYVSGWDSVQSGLVVVNQPQVGLTAPSKKNHPKAFPTSKEVPSRSM